MPNYEICYLDENGHLAFKFAARCIDETRAKILAHAMKQPEHKRIEVWDEATLVYERPVRLEHDMLASMPAE
jgi:hypothetical protein